MITVASVDYCERCTCKTLHLPLPNGERACEHHLPEPELVARVAGCRCQWEQGDSPCPVHGENEGRA